jgi:hypothetical protein
MIRAVIFTMTGLLIIIVALPALSSNPFFLMPLLFCGTLLFVRGLSRINITVQNSLHRRVVKEVKRLVNHKE